MTDADGIRIILCHPEGSRNVGAVCRAMKTMGLGHLVIVGRHEKFDLDQVRMTALHAFDVFADAKFVESLDDALVATALSAGVTRRLGARRKYQSLLPEELAERVLSISAPVGIVFGTERTGLSDEELSHCDIAVRIPSSPEFPSLNLSHAVQVIAYAIHRQSNPLERLCPVNRERVEQVVDTVIQSLKGMDYFTLTDGTHTAQLFREVLARAGLHESEAARIEKLFRNLPHIARNG